MSYVYVKSEENLWTVGFYKPSGEWVPESDHDSRDDAAARVAFLNGEMPEPKLVLGHTAGPWILCSDNDEGEDFYEAGLRVFAVSQLENGRIPADVWDSCIASIGYNDENLVRRGNARLISSAPTMFSALQRIEAMRLNDFLGPNTMALAAVHVARECVRRIIEAGE